MTKSMLSTGLLTFIFSSLMANFAIADAYAPLLDKNKASGHPYLLSELRGAERDLPSSSEVPVAAYTRASVFAVSEIPSVSNSKYQTNGIVFLGTTDSREQVLNFYRSELKGWKHKSLKNGKEVLLKTGNQLWWGGNELLEGPRVEIIDISVAGKMTSAGVGGAKLKEAIPSMSTVIKVFYQKEISELLAVNTEKVMAGCIAAEVESKKKLMGGQGANSQADQYFVKMAKSTCERVQNACDKDTKGSRCQRYARLYG